MKIFCHPSFHSATRVFFFLFLAIFLPARALHGEQIAATDVDPNRDYVLINGHQAHPTRILAKLVDRNEDLKDAPSLQNTGSIVAHRFAVGGLILLDSADGMAPKIANEQEAEEKGKVLADRIDALQQSGLFAYVEPDYIVRVDADPTDTFYTDGTLWGLRNTGQNGGTIDADVSASPAWDITTGSTNVVIAVIDTGIRYTHQDLAAQMWVNPGEIPGNGTDDDGNGYVDDVYGINAITGSGNPMDDHDHGSHVAGTIGAAANDGHPHVGVMWNVRLMGCKFLSAGGSGFTSDGIECVDYAVAQGARISNNSWGGGGFSQALFDSIEAAQNQGHLFVAAAGNSGLDNDTFPHYPSSYDLDGIVAVAAMDRFDALAGFSNYGQQSVDLGGPGVAIHSCTADSDTSYATFSGTSMATPHVSGVVGLMLSEFPLFGPLQLKQQLLNTAIPIPALTGRCVTGARANALYALSLAPIIVPATNFISGGNGNGRIDFNECNEVFIVLTNIGLTDATNVQASISTTNEGVIVVQRSSLYPSLPTGASGTNLTAFKISTAPTFVCGTPLQFALVIKSDLETRTNFFTLPTGTIATQPIRFDNSTVTNIPDNNPVGIFSSITVSNIAAPLGRAVVSLHITHTFDFDLSMELIAPDGTKISLSENNGFNGDNYGNGCADSSRTIFDDNATVPISAGTPPFSGTFRPQSPLGVLKGKTGAALNGVWQLHIVDSIAIDTGALQCWSLQLFPATCDDGGGECPGVDVAINMTGFPDPVVLGSNLVYSITVTNSGPDTAKGVVVTHTLPPGAVFVSASASQGGASQSGGIVTGSLGNIPARSIATMIVVCQLTAAGTTSSTAAVISNQNDFDPSNNSATVVSHVTPPSSDLSVTISDSPDPLLVGDLLTYTVTLMNNGPAPANNTVVTNILPGSAAFVSAVSSQGTCSNLNNGIVLANLGTVTNGGTATITIVVRPTVTGSITASAQASSGQSDPLPGNNSASASTSVTPAANLGISILDFPDPVVRGSNITYTIIVTNHGPNEASEVVVSDNLGSTNVNFISANVTQGTTNRSGNIVTWNVGNVSSGGSATLTIVVATTRTGTIANNASVSASQADPSIGNNSAAASTVVSEPFIQIVPAGMTLTSESFSPANGTVDFGETVTIDFRLRNAGNIGTTNVVATLQATGGVLSPSGPQSYGALSASGLPVSKAFTFTAATNGSAIVATFQVQDGGVSVPPGTVTFAIPLPVTSVFANTNEIVIPDVPGGSLPFLAAPYPSSINASGVTGLVDNVSVTLVNMNHTFPDDVDMVLVSPTGQKLIMMSDALSAVGESGLVNATFTLDDRAATTLPDSETVSLPSYRPADYEPGDVFPNGPSAPFGTTFSIFDGANPNGTWSLYVVDDAGGDFGNIANGWRLNITTITPLNKIADLAMTVSDSPDPVWLGGNLTYTFSITNSGPDVATGVTFNNVLPGSVSLLTATSSGIISTVGNTVAGNLGTLPVGSNATVTVVVTPNAAGALTNSASVLGSEVDLNSANSLATAVTTVSNLTVDLGVSLSGSANPVTVGSNLIYTISLTNHGPQTALQVQAVDVLPTGMTFISATTSQGTATNSGQTVTCSLGTIIAGSTATATIVVTPTAAGNKTNTVTVATASNDGNITNNSAKVITTVQNPAPVVVAAGAILTSEANPANGTVDLGETVTMNLFLANVGSANATNLTATLQSSGGVTALSAPQSYGTLVPGGASVSRTFTFRANPAGTNTVTATLQLQSGGTSLGTATFAFSLPMIAKASNTNAINIPQNGVANPYPSTINISGLTGLVSKVTVTLSNVTHSFPDDLDILLVSPAGQKVLLMSDAGGGHGLTNVTITLDDSVSAALPDANRINVGNISSVTNKPADYLSGETITPPAPGGPYDSVLTAFNGMNPNGTWSLYVVDDAGGDGGSISGGWSISVTAVNTVNPAAELAATLSAPTGSIYVGDSFTTTINVVNNGPESAAGILVTDTLPTGLSLVSSNTTQGTVSATSGAITANLGTLGSGSTASVTLVLRATVAGTITNQANVTSAQTDLNPVNNSPRAILDIINVPVSQLNSVSMLNGQFQFTLSGQPGIAYIIQASTNLVNWTPISTNTAAASGTFKFSDANSPGLPQRYYRALRTP